MFFQQDSTQNDQPQQIDLNPGAALERIDSWVDGFMRLLPNIVVGIIIMVLFYFLGRLVRQIVRNRATAYDRENLGEVLGGLVKWIVIIIGFFLAATVIIPSLKPGDLIAGLGVSSVAIGFAFKDILQNWLAGLLILLRQPFQVGDQIEVGDYEGTVERIETRATIIKLYNNERAVVPNSDIYTGAVKVKTANPIIRSQYDVGIGYGDDISEAVTAIKEAMGKVEGVSSEKEFEVIPWELAESWVALRVRWWTDSQRASVVQVHGRVIQQVKEALDAAGIDMPYDTQVMLVHDQTEASDGDRAAQREGWPSMGEGQDPGPRWKEQDKERGQQQKDTETTRGGKTKTAVDGELKEVAE